MHQCDWPGNTHCLLLMHLHAQLHAHKLMMHNTWMQRMNGRMHKRCRGRCRLVY